MKRLNKRGFELSVSFIVIIIITLLLVGLSFYILNVIREGSSDISEQLDAQTKQQIEQLITEQNAIVALPYNLKEVDTNDFVQIGVGIKNIDQSPSEFMIKVVFDAAYRLNGQKIAQTEGLEDESINREWVGTSDSNGPFRIAPLAFESFPLIVKVGSKMGPTASTIPGEYVFNVCVYRASGVEPRCTLAAKSTEGDLLYPPQKIQQFTLRVQ